MFTPPDGWTHVPPESAGHGGLPYVAVRDRNATDPVATNIVVSGFVAPAADVDAAALASDRVVELKSQYPVTVLKRDVLEEGRSPEVAQLLQIEYPAGGSTVTLKQIEIVNVFPGAADPAEVAVLRLMMTCPEEVFDDAGPEFSQFVAGIAETMSNTAGGS